MVPVMMALGMVLWAFSTEPAAVVAVSTPIKPHSVSALAAFEAVTSDSSIANGTGLSAGGGAPL